MDQDTRFALASLYEQLGEIAEQAFEARAAAVGLEKAISENSRSMAEPFQLHVHSPTATEIKLRAAIVQGSIRQVIDRLRTLAT